MPPVAYDNYWTVRDQYGKACRHVFAPPGGIYGHVMLNQTTANIQWAVSRHPGSFYEGHSDVLATGFVTVTLPDLSRRDRRERALAVARELVEYLVLNDECLAPGGES